MAPNNDQETLEKLLEKLLEEVISVGQTESSTEQSILRQRIQVVSRHRSLSVGQKTRVIQKLTMESGAGRELNVSDLWPKLQENEAKPLAETKEVEPYDEANDYNLASGTECTHFYSNTKLYSQKTGLWYECKRCFQRSDSESKVEDLSHVMCGKCSFVAPKGTKSCPKCEGNYASFSCFQCRIFEDNEENVIYHCPHCNECKLGEGIGIDYNHCFDCNCCMPLEMFHNEEPAHKCIRNNLVSDCPICGEDLKENADLQVEFLIPCNHTIHQKCLQLYLENGQFKCPVCQISIVDMEINFKLLDGEIRNCPLPAPYTSWRCVYKCNDCDARGITNYHFLGIKCRSCYSFNTILLQVVKDDDVAGERKEEDFGATKRSSVSTEMVNSSFMSRADTVRSRSSSNMDGFLNDFLSKDEDLSLSHLLVGLKQYYSNKRRIKSDFLPNDVEEEGVELLSQSVEHRNRNSLFNDIRHSFKQFLSLLEDNENHEP